MHVRINHCLGAFIIGGNTTTFLTGLSTNCASMGETHGTWLMQKEIKIITININSSSTSLITLPQSAKRLLQITEVNVLYEHNIRVMAHQLMIT